jgi:thymidylate synthase (FAD)
MTFNSTVELVSYTTPSVPSFRKGIGSFADIIAYCARVSNPQNQTNTQTYGKLLQYLIDHKHWSPLEMVDLTFEITTSRDIARQMLRHRSFSFQEFSQRYADPALMAMDTIFRDVRLQDKKNRQNSTHTNDESLQALWFKMQEDVDTVTRSYYKQALDAGIAKEVARAILPEGMTPSRLYMKGSLRSWLHYIEVRTDPSTQLEHREIATKIKRLVDTMFDPSKELTKDND